jgi:hypothetical protein
VGLPAGFDSGASLTAYRPRPWRLRVHVLFMGGELGSLPRECARPPVRSLRRLVACFGRGRRGYGAPHISGPRQPSRSCRRPNGAGDVASDVGRRAARSRRDCAVASVTRAAVGEFAGADAASLVVEALFSRAGA